MANELTNVSNAYGPLTVGGGIGSYMTVPVQQDHLRMERFAINPNTGERIVVPPNGGPHVVFAVSPSIYRDEFQKARKATMSFQTGSRKVVEGHIGTVQFDGVEVYETSQAFDKADDASDAARRTLTGAVAKLLNPASRD